MKKIMILFLTICVGGPILTAFAGMFNQWFQLAVFALTIISLGIFLRRYIPDGA